MRTTTHSTPLDPPRAFRRDGLGQRIAPFALAGLGAISLAPLVSDHVDVELLLVAGVANLALIVAAVLVPWKRLPRWTDAVLPLLGFVVFSLARDATGGGDSVLNPLMVLPVLWLAMHGTRRDVLAALAALAATLLLPIVAINGDEYPSGELVRAVLWLIVAATAGLTMRRFVDAAAHQNREAEATALARARLAAVVEHSVDAVIGTSVDGTIETWNEGATRLYGHVAEAALGRHVSMLAPEAERAQLEELHRQVAAGELVQRHETRRRTADGRLVDVAVTMSPIRGVGDRTAGVAYIERDATERRRAELASRRANEELRHASELKSQFVAMVSHELRTPLTSIRGFASTLRDLHEQIPPEEQRRYAEIIEAQAMRLARLVDDVLVLSRIESGALRSRLAPVNLREVIDRTLARLDMHADVVVRCEPDLPVIADDDQLEQLLVNYLANARRYGRPPYEVVASGGDSYVRVEVRDAGPGVPEEFVDRLYERFSKAAENATGDAHGGTGLGLSIVRALAHAQGGDAWYEPGQPRGARFCFSLRRPGAMPPSPD